MSGGAGIVGYAVGLAMLGLGVWLAALQVGGGVALIVIGAVVIVALLLEPRYRRQSLQGTPLPPNWRPTGERFIDDESGRLIEVWYDPASGERRYSEVGPPD
jgi:hypothetical protein